MPGFLHAILRRILPAALAAILLTAPAHSQPSSLCVERKAMVDLLTAQYLEVRLAIGLSSSGDVVEVFASKDGSSWTIIVTKPDGVTCPLATGESWMSTKNLPGRLS